LINPNTWLDAGAQVFFSFGLAWGGLISFSSYNPLHNNCKNDAIILSVVTAATSVYAAMVTYTIIGFRATAKYDQSRIQRQLWGWIFSPVTCKSFLVRYLYSFLTLLEVLHASHMSVMSFQGVEGPGLAFIVFTEAIINMPASPAWAVLFFIMLLCLGLSTLIGTFEGVIVPFTSMPRINLCVSGVTFLTAFIITLLFAQHSGFYWVTLFDNFAGSVPLLCIGLFEIVIVVYVYGVDRFNEDIKFMIGSKPGIFWQVTWRFVSPLIMLVILIFYLVTQAQGELTYLVWDPSSVS
uniref:Uncharacterized protein n=1 Tax=Periophthalmus magnuspinnatus TaxID=409849 RepID=A0A3B4AMW0_9GOBI